MSSSLVSAYLCFPEYFEHILGSISYFLLPPKAANLRREGGDTPHPGRGRDPLHP
jgi:hypothetical protein